MSALRYSFDAQHAETFRLVVVVSATAQAFAMLEVASRELNERLQTLPGFAVVKLEAGTCLAMGDNRPEPKADEPKEAA